MKTRIVRIGNSRGVRLPKPLLEEAGLPEEVEVRARNGSIIIVPAARAHRAEWEEAARKLRSRDGDRLLDPPTPTRFDEEEWNW
ncbi:MAG: AbrB/MazE/SpoVT family DNA-binding domain-containing protein [Candidatus Binatia bacterium]